MIQFIKQPTRIIKGTHKNIYDFGIDGVSNIDGEVITSFGEEWKKFFQFDNEEIEKMGKYYFDSLDGNIINKNTSVLDVGCGTGRWTKYLSSRVSFIEALDPSKAIFYADQLLKDTTNVRLSIASTENIPFANETFDFVMSVGVLHHIPDTQKAMNDCVNKVKKGGYFYTYLYYSFDNRGWIFKTIFKCSDLIRRIVSNLPSDFKKIICDILAFTIYVPLVLLCRFLRTIGLVKIASRVPLYAYHDKSLFVIRNDSLDRFGTVLEQRFSKKEIEQMMLNAGLCNIFFPKNAGYWVAVGQKRN